MRSTWCWLIVLLNCSLARAQQVLSFDEAKTLGIRTSLLDSTYQSGIHADSTKAVFVTNAEEFQAAYVQLLQDLGSHLKANGFNWERPTKGFNRIYFAPDGTIDRFLYSFKPGQLTVEQERRFAELLKGFVSGYRFPMRASTGFAQCSPVTYAP